MLLCIHSSTIPTETLVLKVHSKGLKFGIYSNYGHSTCMGFPGTDDDHMELDAKKFASWDVDYVKMDGCHTSADEQKEGYIKFGKYLNQTNRHIVYSCSWPYYDLHNNKREVRNVVLEFGVYLLFCNPVALGNVFLIVLCLSSVISLS